MYKLILVDDNETERRGLSGLSIFPQYGVKIAGEAWNGRQGLELFDTVEPDIVMSDIRMPVMDGITFTAKIKARKPGVHIILMSGYEDFNAAKEALSIGADAYLTKPLRVDELERALVHITSSINADADAAYEAEQMRARIDAMQPMIKERLLRDLLLGVRKIEDSDTIREISDVGLFLRGGMLAVLLIKVELGSPEGNLQACMLTIHDILSSMSMTLTMSMPIAIQNGLFALIAFLPRRMNDEAAFDHLQQCAAYLLERIRLQSGYGVTIAISDIRERESDLALMYKRAFLTMQQYAAYGLNNVYWYDDEEADRPMPDACAVAKRVFDDYKRGWADNVGRTVGGFYQAMQAANASIETMRAMSCQFLTYLILQSAKDSGELVGILERDETPYARIMEVEMVDELAQYMTELVKLDKNNDLLKSKTHSEGLVASAMAYIRENYTSNISAETIAKVIFVTPAHLRRIFKNVTSQTIQDCILSCRMEKARDLLLFSSMKVSEVARAVGYDNPPYFNIVFKKYYGIAPGEYRHGLGNGQTTR